MTTLLVLTLWAVLALLYVTRRRVATVVYLLVLPAFPFYWAPLYMVPFNDLTMQRTVAVGIAMGLLLETVREMQRRHLASRRLALELLVLLMVCLWSVSGFEQRTFSAAFRGMAINLLDFWVPFSLGVRIAYRAEGLRFLMKWIALPALGVAALALWEYIAQAPITWNFFSDLYRSTNEDWWAPTVLASVVRVQATLGQSIFLGFYLACAGLLCLVLGSLSSTRRWTVLCYGSGAVLLVGSLLPMSRGAMIGMVLSLVCLSLLTGGRARVRIMTGALLAVGVLWASASYFEGSNSYLGDFLSTLTGQAPTHVQSQQLKNFDDRIEIVQTGYYVITSAPLFGHGDISVGGRWPIRDVANVFVQVGVVAGPAGLAMLLIFVLVLGVQLIRLWQRQRHADTRALVSGLMAVFILILVSWLDSSWPGQFTQVAWLFMGAIACLSVSATKVPVTSRGVTADESDECRHGLGPSLVAAR